MNRETLWKLYCERNPKFAKEGANFTAKGLRDFFERVYAMGYQEGREVTARFHMDESKRHHKMVIGHFHSALNQQDWMIGGSLSGTDANDHKEGRHSLPHQTAWFVHPSHGEFSWTRFWL